MFIFTSNGAGLLDTSAQRRTLEVVGARCHYTQCYVLSLFLNGSIFYLKKGTPQQLYVYIV